MTFRTEFQALEEASLKWDSDPSHPLHESSMAKEARSLIAQLTPLMERLEGIGDVKDTEVRIATAACPARCPTSHAFATFVQDLLHRFDEERAARFQPFSKIANLEGLQVRITEKIHGSNALLSVSANGTLHIGSRTRWLNEYNDNYGFFQWASKHREALVAFLGEGFHYGEWYGNGINHGYGLKEKRLALFRQDFYTGTLPAGVDLVPVLYEGPYSPEQVDACLARLQTEGSVLQPGCLSPEGVMCEFVDLRVRLKRVLDPETTGWRKGGGEKVPKERIPMEALFEKHAAWLQPIRLEKLFSRDEAFVRGFPQNIREVVDAYLDDLGADGPQGDERKSVLKVLFPWIKMERAAVQGEG